MRLLLASQSQTRQRLLRAAGVAFEPVGIAVDERGIAHQGLLPAELAASLATIKAEAFVGEDAYVLGCDQTLELADGELLHKAGSRAEAETQLRRMSGSVHQLHAAAAIQRDGEVVWNACECVRMSVRPLGEGFIKAYLDAAWPDAQSSVGCYHIEGIGSQLFDRIDGSHFAVLGLPLLPLLAFLRAEGLLAR